MSALRLLTIWKPIAAAFLAGGIAGAYTTHKLSSTFQTAQTVRQVEANLISRSKESSRREHIAAQHEVDREAVDLQTEEQGHELDRYLERRTDVRDLDLGTDWLCIIDRTAGRAAPRCPGEPAAPVPGAGGAARRDGGRGAARVPAGDASVSDLPQPARTARGGGTAPDETEPFESP